MPVGQALSMVGVSMMIMPGFVSCTFGRRVGAVGARDVLP
jgi:hypothetical protein